MRVFYSNIKTLYELSQTVQLQKDKLMSQNTHIIVGYLTTFKSGTKMFFTPKIKILKFGY